MGLSEKELRERGIFRSPDEMVGEAGEMVALSLAGMPLESLAGEPAREFTEGELEALGRGGLDPSGVSEGGASSRTVSGYAALMASALTESETAAFLGVSESRVRQRIGEGTLYSVRVGRERRLPRFQFSGDGSVPGAGEVLKRVPDDAHPLAVERWFTRPDPDLVLEEEPVSPREWLLSGGPLEVIGALAAEL